MSTGRKLDINLITRNKDDDNTSQPIRKCKNTNYA